MDKSTNAHIKSGNAIVEWVWYEGTDALLQGEGVCYNTDYGTATDSDARRANRVERPSSSNNFAFAGVAARSYTAKSTGQFIEIYCPGSRGVMVALAVDTVLDTGMLSFIGGSNSTGSERGRFYTGLYPGRGSAVPRETVTAALETEMNGDNWSLSADGLTLTVASTTGVSAGDTVVLLGGEDDATGKIVPGKYVVSSVTDSTTLVLSSAAVDTTAAGALVCGGIIYTGNPMCLADLLTGEECGGVEFLVVDNSQTVAAQTHQVGGVTYIGPVSDVAAGGVDFDLAQGTALKNKKAFVLLSAVTSGDFTITLATNAIQRDGATTLTGWNAIDAAADAVYAQFAGAWATIAAVGGAAEK